MKKIGLFYGIGTAKTKQVADRIQKAFGDVKVDIVAIEEAGNKDFKEYDYIIAGAATWFDGELPTYWDELLPDLDTLKMNGKKVAIFGLGDQRAYPENFVDGIGLLAEIFEAKGAKLVGQTSTKGYTFESSRAVRDDKFLGLVIDFENQHAETDKRIKDWVEGLKKEFK